MDKYDKLTIGDFITELYLESSQGEPISKQILSQAIGKEYDLKLRLDIPSQSIFVKNTGINDDSKVYELIEPNIRRITDTDGRNITATLSNQLNVAENTRLTGGVFNGTVPDTNFYTTVLNANGTATITNSELKLTTTNDSGSSSLIYTNSTARCIGGNMNEFRDRIRLDTGIAGNTRRWGLFDIVNGNNGAYFELFETQLRIVIKTSGLDDIIYNLDYVLDTNYHIYQILYINGGFEFYIDNIRVYKAIETNRILCGTRHLKAFASNAGKAKNMYIRFLTIIMHGQRKTQPKYSFNQRSGTDIGRLLKTGIGSLHAIVLSGITNGCIITLYDNTTATGNIIWTSGSMGPQTAPFEISFNDGIQFENGLYVSITGANGNIMVLYE